MGLINTGRFLLTHPLSRKRPLNSLWRFVHWQALSRLSSSPKCIEWIEGQRLVVERGMRGASGNIYVGLHEFVDMSLLLHYYGSENDSSAFLDVGANVGSFTLLAAGVCRIQSVACEPVPQTYNRLQRNLSVNELSHLVDARRVAIGAKPGKMRFSIDQDCKNTAVGDEYEGISEVTEVSTIDEVLSEIDQFPDFWKIDVEGFESSVLEGASASLSDQRVQVVLLEGDSAEIQKTMQAAGFLQVGYDPWKRRIVQDFDAVHSGNRIWVRDPAWVEHRCHRSRRYAIYGTII